MRPVAPVLGLVFVFAATFLVVAVPAGAQSPAEMSPSTLAVTVNGLRAGLDAAVTVTGPDGYQAALTRTEVLGSLPSGRYTVTASSVTDRGGTHWPVPTTWPRAWQTSVVVSAQEHSTVTVNYLDYVSHDVSVVPLGATESLVADGRGEELDVVRQRAGQIYREGEILVSAPTPVAPDGYIVRVSTVEASSESTLETLDVHPVPLDEAVPEADVEEHANLATYNSIFESERLSCRTGGALTLSAEFHVTPSFTLKAQWGSRKQRSAEFDVALNEDASSQIVAAARLRCEVRPVDLGPSVALAPHGVVVFFVGPVPVVIRATLGVVAEGSVNLDAPFRAYVEQRAELGVHLYYASAKDQRGAELIRDFKVSDGSFTRGILGSAEMALVPELRLRLYGLAGPTAGVKLYAELVFGHYHRSLSVCARLQGHLHLPRFKKVLPWEGTPSCREVARLLSR
jgi:hypothetical protein